MAQAGANYVLTTGTGSGKSLAYIIPIVDHVLKRGSGRGVQAIVVYPMNALANSQEGELKKFLQLGYPDGKGPVTFARYTGQEKDDKRNQIIAKPPDIILTNYVMLELILTRPIERPLIESAQGLRFLVLDELHTYRGRQGADVALLVRRVRDRLAAERLQCVGTSATLSTAATYDQQPIEVARVATDFFGAEVKPEHVIGETLRRATQARDISDSAFVSDLKACLAQADHQPPRTYAEFISDPLSIWLEDTFGLTTEPGTERLVRAQPRSISGDERAAWALRTLTGVPIASCEHAIQQRLMAGCRCLEPETGFPLFAFRLHQFISRGDTVYASIEPEDRRHITLYRQQYVPADRQRILLPLVFCRECGQEYYCVMQLAQTFAPRELSTSSSADDGESGFVYYSSSNPWSEDPEEVLKRVPDDWIEEHRGGRRVRRDRRRYLPQAVRVGADGQVADRLLQAKAEANIEPDVARDFLQKVMDTFDALRPYLDGVAIQRGNELLDAHRRVRTAARWRGVQCRVEPQLPTDVLGIYIYLPKG